jgi:L-fuconolactonase
MEQVLEPDLAICDPHHHLWSHPGDRYLMEELRADIGSGHRVERTVFVECRSAYRADGPGHMAPVGETDFVVAADPGGPIAGIVGFADLRDPAIGDVLAAHIEAGRGRFRGIRHISAWDPSLEATIDLVVSPPGLLGDPAFRSGFAALGRAGLGFDAWLYHPQLPELTALARAHPDVPIVLDHLGGPLGTGRYRRADVRPSWRAAMADVAACPNVTLKLGGIGMPIFGADWHDRPGGATSEEIASAWGDDIRWCIEAFGADRCMFESNFPVDKVSCSYRNLWNAFKRMAAGASPSEKAALFAGTAVRTYRL